MPTLQPPAMSTAQDFQALFTAAVDGIVIIDARGHILQFNPAAERQFGYAAAEVLGSNVSVLMAEPERSAHDQHLRRYVATREAHIIGKGREVEARRKDGSIFPVFLSVGAVQGENPPRFVGFVQDISYRRKAEEDTHRLQQRLTHVSRLATIGEMSAGIAHELNQPLTAVANYAQACDRLLGMPDPDLEEVRQALREITSQAVRAGEIIRRLRALARIEVMHREPTDLNAMIRELTDLIQIEAKERAVRYELQLATQLSPVNVDRAQMQQVIVNLVRNAVESFQDDAEERLLTVRTATMAGDEVEIAVCDNGPGVAAQIEPRLFEPFCTTKPHGTGLGLAISNTIVKSNGGTLEHRPNVPRGACFVIRLPLRDGEDA